MKGMILRLLFSEFHRQTCKVCHKLAKIKTTKEGEEEEVFSLANFSKSSLSWSARAKELTDGERGLKWFDQLLPHLLILSERSAGIIICHMLWHAGITLFVMACRAAGTVERSGEKIPRVGGSFDGSRSALHFERRATLFWWRAAPRGDAVTSIFDVSCGVRCVTIKDEDNLEMSLSIYTRRVSMRGSRLGWGGSGSGKNNSAREDAAGAGGRGIVSTLVKRRRGAHNLGS